MDTHLIRDTAHIHRVQVFHDVLQLPWSFLFLNREDDAVDIVGAAEVVARRIERGDRIARDEAERVDVCSPMPVRAQHVGVALQGRIRGAVRQLLRRICRDVSLSVSEARWKGASHAQSGTSCTLAARYPKDSSWYARSAAGKRRRWPRRKIGDWRSILEVVVVQEEERRAQT